MKKFANTTEETLITFHIGRGGRFHNGGHKSYVDQDMTINTYTDDLFVAYENANEIFHKIGDRPNLRAMFERAIDDNSEAIARIERITGMTFGKQVYTDCNGSHVGLAVENDDTGIINIDGDYDTTIVKRLQDCTEQELLLIYESNRYKSPDVEAYAFMELNVVSAN